MRIALLLAIALLQTCFVYGAIVPINPTPQTKTTDKAPAVQGDALSILTSDDNKHLTTESSPLSGVILNGVSLTESPNILITSGAIPVEVTLAGSTTTATGATGTIQTAVSTSGTQTAASTGATSTGSTTTAAATGVTTAGATTTAASTGATTTAASTKVTTTGVATPATTTKVVQLDNSEIPIDFSIGPGLFPSLDVPFVTPAIPPPTSFIPVDFFVQSVNDPSLPNMTPQLDFSDGKATQTKRTGGSDPNNPRYYFQPVQTLVPQTYLYLIQASISLYDDKIANLSFYATLTAFKDNCATSFCYYGWIDNFTTKGETFEGFRNKSLAFKPVFMFSVSDQTNYNILRHPKLQQAWVQLIEIICDKVHPFVLVKSYKVDNLTNEKTSINTQNISLNGLINNSSNLTESIVFNADNIIKSRIQNYSLKLNSTVSVSNSTLTHPTPQTKATLNITLLRKRDHSPSDNKIVSDYLFTKNNSQNYTLKNITERRSKFVDIFYPEMKTPQNNAQKAIIKHEAQPLAIAGQLIKTVPDVLNYSKVLLLMQLHGSNLTSNVQVKCNMDLYTKTQRISCNGQLKLHYSNLTKSITIVNYTQDLKQTYLDVATWTGNWSITNWTNFQQPIDYLGLLIAFTIQYKVTVNITGVLLANKTKFNVGHVISVAANMSSSENLKMLDIDTKADFIGKQLIKSTLSANGSLAYTKDGFVSTSGFYSIKNQDPNTKYLWQKSARRYSLWNGWSKQAKKDFKEWKQWELYLASSSDNKTYTIPSQSIKLETSGSTSESKKVSPKTIKTSGQLKD